MTYLSVRLPDDIIKDLDLWRKERHLSKSDLVREALLQYRDHQLALARSKRLTKASHLVSQHSLKVNQEFEIIEGDNYDDAR